MNRIFKSVVLSVALLFANSAVAQSSADDDELKIAAIEALMAAPAEKALPVVARVMTSNNSVEVKSRALFVLSQIDDPEAHRILLDTATNAVPPLQMEAIRMIGISGDDALTSELGGLYQAGNPDVKEAVLHAYMIADDVESVYEIAAAATTDQEFESAVHMLGAMGATGHLKRLRDHPGSSEILIHAYAMAGDTESLIAMSRDNSDPEKQMQAIHGLGVAGGDEVNATLLDIYRGTDNREVREAVMHGMMMADYDEGLLELFKSSQDSQEKAELLRQLVMMDSDAAMEAIDAALSGAHE